jgi:hypothetical protein
MSIKNTRPYVGRIKIRSIARIGRIKVVDYGSKTKIKNKCK